MVKQKLLLTQECALGDNVLMTAAVRDLRLAHGDKYEIHVRTHFPKIWEHNPHVDSWTGPDPSNYLRDPMNYGGYILKADTMRLHFLTAYHRILEERLKISVPVTRPAPDLHLPKSYLAKLPMTGRYWVMMAGGKGDFTTKIWSYHNFQETVNKLRDLGISVVQLGNKDDKHSILQNTVNLIGKTDYIDLMWFIKHADGVICPITSAMHIAAAFDRPCVVVAGGREHHWWVSYVNSRDKIFGPTADPVAMPHRFLHTQELLHCCKSKGCWKNKVVTKEQDMPGYHCLEPVNDGYGQILPKCMGMITPEMVVDAVLSYYVNGSLEPLK